MARLLLAAAPTVLPAADENGDTAVHACAAFAPELLGLVLRRLGNLTAKAEAASAGLAAALAARAEANRLAAYVFGKRFLSVDLGCWLGFHVAHFR